MRIFGLGVLIAAFALVGNGCGKVGLTKVQGTVTLDGKPIESARVTFVPAEAGGGKTAIGRTGLDGTFQLTTTTPNDGAFPGDYLVVVQYDDGTEVSPRKEKPKKPKYIIPAIYTTASKTTLRQKLPTKGLVELKLQSK